MKNTKKVTVLDLINDTGLSNLRVGFGSLMNNRRDNYPVADSFDLMNDFLYLAAEPERPDAIILVTGDKFTRMLIKRDEMTDRNMGHLEYFDMCDKSTTLVAALHIVNDEKYPEIKNVSIDEVKEILAGWDDECKVGISPTVPENERVVVADYDNRMSELEEKARKNDSLGSLHNAISRLANSKYHRLTIFPSFCLEEVGFLLETIQMDGSYKKVFNGGIIYRENRNEWTTHT